MTLTARLTSFFLAVLACVLAGFSIGLYCLASRYLHDQIADRLAAATHTLAASADVGPEGIEWEPASRSMTLGQDASPDEVRWLVQDARGRVVDRSRNLDEVEVNEFRHATEGRASSEADWSVSFASGDRWRLGQTRILVDRRAAPGSPESATEKSGEQGGKLFSQLSLTVGVSLAPVEATLRNLAFALVGLSIGLWCLAAVSGRWLCRRALMPVIRMADAARRIDADDLRSRLPIPNARDELHELADAFNDLLTRLQEAYERQRRFTGDASHQLRTPIAAMLGQVDVALLRERSPDEYRRVLETVRSQAHRLRQIVESQLFLARADAESLAPKLETVDLAEWLPTYLESWRGHPRWSDIRFQNSASGPTETNTHLQLLAQLLDNLLDNAAKYSPPGTPIIVDLGVADNAIECSVEDGGSGIAPDDLPHIFEPFFRSARARQSGTAGAGLGLAVAQRIAAALGGTIRAGMLSGGGMSFTLRIPGLPGNDSMSTLARSASEGTCRLMPR